MATNENSVETKGNEVMKAVGELKQRTRNLDKVNSETDSDAKEIGSWITIIGKALLAIFK